MFPFGNFHVKWLQFFPKCDWWNFKFEYFEEELRIHVIKFDYLATSIMMTSSTVTRIQLVHVFPLFKLQLQISYPVVKMEECSIISLMNHTCCYQLGRRGSMVVVFTSTYVINVNHHWSCEFKSRPRRGVLDTTLCDQVCQWLAVGRWFPRYPPLIKLTPTI
jgi:hypothetical protein